MKENVFKVNNKDVGIKKIELDNSGNIEVLDKDEFYSLNIITQYDLNKLEDLKPGETKEVYFNEYEIVCPDGPALIWPETIYVTREKDDVFYMDFDFSNLEKEATYMNMKNAFEEMLKTIELKITVDYKEIFNKKGKRINGVIY